MKLEELLDKLFPAGRRIEPEGVIVHGTGRLADKEVAIIGTQDDTPLGARELLRLARLILEVVEKSPGTPILMLVSSCGQRMALNEELLGLGQYIAVCLQAQETARRVGHKLVALIYGQAVAGGFIAFGLGADRICAAPDAQTFVMNLKAVARVTKQPLDRLEALAEKIPVFAPGVGNFFKMGGLNEIWEDVSPERLERLLAATDTADTRATLGEQRGGRALTQKIIDEIVNR